MRIISVTANSFSKNPDLAINGDEQVFYLLSKRVSGIQTYASSALPDANAIFTYDILGSPQSAVFIVEESKATLITNAADTESGGTFSITLSDGTSLGCNTDNIIMFVADPSDNTQTKMQYWNATQLKVQNITITGAASDLQNTFNATVDTMTDLVLTGTLHVVGNVTFDANLTYKKEVNHIVSVAATTTAAAVGGGYAVAAGAGATTGNGGIASVTGGASGGGATGNGGLAYVAGGASAATDGVGGIGKVVGGAGAGTGNGGDVQVIGGAGGATSGVGGVVTITSGAGGSISGASGAVNITSGAAANVTSGSASASGAITINSGAGATSTTGTAGASGAVVVKSLNGGAASGAAGIGGNAGSVTVLAGNGGAAASATGGVPGTGGAIIITGGNGGAAAGTGVAGGAATACTITTGTGGASTHASGGAGGAGAALTITAGNGGAVTNAAVAGGVGGAISFVAGNAGAGSTAGSAGGAITFTGGNGVGTAGAPGNITFLPGSTSMTTVASLSKFNKGKVWVPTVASVASGGTITGKQIVEGNISGTGATGNWQMPAASVIVTALGFTPTVGTTIPFNFVANGMTAANIATLLVGAGMTAAKQTSSGDSANDQLLTITNTSNVNVGNFRIVFDSASTCILHRDS